MDNRSLRRSSPSVLRAGMFTLLALASLAGAVTPSRAEASDGGQKCQQVTEALMSGNVDGGVVAIDPALEDRDALREALSRMVIVVRGLVKDKKPRLERTLQSIEVGNYPLSLQIWSFGDQEVYLVGCLLHRKQEKAQVELQIRNSVDEIVKHMKIQLSQKQKSKG